MDTEPLKPDSEAEAHCLAVIAQSETVWTWFVRSGHAEVAMLRRAQADLERSLRVEKGAKGARERQWQGVERIRRYLGQRPGSVALDKKGTQWEKERR